MKKFLKLCYAALLVGVASCSEDQVEPQLTDDLATSANGYWDQFLSIHITTTWDDDILFYLIGTGGQVKVDWGDGTVEKIYVSSGFTAFEHDYQREEDNPGNFAIRISGAIKTITEFEYYYDDVLVNEMHFGGLPNLRRIDMGVLAYGPPVINLSKNRQLESVILGGTQRLENLILPTVNKIRGIDISGSNNLTTAVVDRVIARIHDSVVNSPRTGFFSFPFLWGQDEDDMSVVGPPSSYSINKLRKLRRKYGWQIFPNIK